MYCPSCGTENEETAKFCKNCGQQLQVETAARPKGSPWLAVLALILVAAGGLVGGLVIYPHMKGTISRPTTTPTETPSPAGTDMLNPSPVSQAATATVEPDRTSTSKPTQTSVPSPTLTPTSPVIPVAADAKNVEFVGQIGGSTNAVAVRGNYAYIGVGPRLVILDVSEPLSPTVVSDWLLLPGVVEDIAMDKGYAYVVAGSEGLRIIDVSDPVTPLGVGFWSSSGEAESVAVTKDHAYVAGGVEGLQVVDVSAPSDPTVMRTFDGLGYADVTVVGHHLYLANGNDGLRVMNISDPAYPDEVGHYSTAASTVAVLNNHAYVAHFAELRVLDISARSDPVEVGSWEIPGRAWSVAAAGHYAFVGTSRGLRIVDVSNPATPMIYCKAGRVSWYDDRIEVELEPYRYADQQRAMEATCARFNAANLHWRDGRALRISVAEAD